MSRTLPEVIADAKKIAGEYYILTKRPLGITGEVGEYEAAKLLGLILAQARKTGFDAVGRSDEKFQIKSRVIRNKNKKGRVPSINISGKTFDAVLLVLLTDDFEPTDIYEVKYEEVKKKLEEPGSKARNERHSLSIRQFISIGTRVWPKTVVSDENPAETLRIE